MTRRFTVIPALGLAVLAAAPPSPRNRGPKGPATLVARRSQIKRDLAYGPHKELIRWTST